MQQLHFPEGSAYRSETGGLMKALRELTVEQSMLQYSPNTSRSYMLLCSQRIPRVILRPPQLDTNRGGQACIRNAHVTQCSRDTGGAYHHCTRPKSRTEA